MTHSDTNIVVEVELDVAFHDCDPMGVVWHGNYFRYLEAARSALLHKINYNYIRMTESGYAWPVIDTRLKFVKPARFGDRISVKASLVEYENRLRIDYIVTNPVTGECLTRGYTTQVAVRLDDGEMCFVSPNELIEKVLTCARST